MSVKLGVFIVPDAADSASTIALIEAADESGSTSSASRTIRSSAACRLSGGERV